MKKIFFSLFVLIFSSMEALSLEKCEWKNTQGKPCIIITKTPNTTFFDEKNINKISINKEDIINSGALDVNDVLKMVNGLDVFQSGEKGQQTSVFTRGSEFKSSSDSPYISATAIFCAICSSVCVFFFTE